MSEKQKPKAVAPEDLGGGLKAAKNPKPMARGSSSASGQTARKVAFPGAAKGMPTAAMPSAKKKEATSDEPKGIYFQIIQICTYKYAMHVSFG